MFVCMEGGVYEVVYVYVYVYVYACVCMCEGWGRECECEEGKEAREGQVKDVVSETIHGSLWEWDR